LNSLIAQVDAEKGRVSNVDTSSVQDPSARQLWCLRRRTTDVRCMLIGTGVPVEVRVIQDRDVVLTEVFQDELIAETWAKAYCARLREQGWRDSSS
jgi:hypothetical protein